MRNGKSHNLGEWKKILEFVILDAHYITLATCSFLTGPGVIS